MKRVAQLHDVDKSERVSIDVGLCIAKTIVFLSCLTVTAIPVMWYWHQGLISKQMCFLVFFATMTVVLVLYFSLGSLLLGIFISGYTDRIRLGERGHAGETALMAVFCNVGVHGVTLCATGIAPMNIGLIVASGIFFTYPVYYLVTMLWSLQPDVRAAITGKKLLNTTHFANQPRRVRGNEDYVPITISLPVYTESNEVIFATIHDSKKAIAAYEEIGQKANLVVSDDGLAKLLGGKVTAGRIEYCLAFAEGNGADIPICSDSLPASVKPCDLVQAAQRIAFYRREKVTFVARPFAGRRGKFKKGGNLNFTYGLAKQLEQGASIDTLIAPQGLYADGYMEGCLFIEELICLLDKDSGLAPGVLAATAPEFAADARLAFTQHTTRAVNAGDNYFAWLQGRFTDMVYQVSLVSKALQGLQVHLMGHSAFLRRNFLEDTGGWAEDRVSEDYAKALDAYSSGWHAKHIAFPGLEFTEQVCTSFVEETDKQLRYCYGVSEVVLGARHRLPIAMFADMIFYYLSYFNLAAALPVIVLLLVTHQIYYLFAGILINAILFLALPVAQGLLLGTAAGFTNPFHIVRYYILIALAFMGHAFSMLRGFLLYFSDRIRTSYEPFGATSVEKKEHSFVVGWALIASYARRNMPVLAAWIIIGIGCFFILQDVPPHIVRPMVVLFLLAHVVSPIILTPQLFVRPQVGLFKRLARGAARLRQAPQRIASLVAHFFG